MSMKITHTITLPDGKTAKRVTTGRRYSHVVIGRPTAATIVEREAYDKDLLTRRSDARPTDMEAWTSWRARSWSGNAKLAEKAALSVASRWGYETRVLPVEDIREREVKTREIVAP